MKNKGITMTELNLKFVHYCPVIQAVILVFGTFVCFVTAYSRGDVSLYLPFISETGAYSPEKCIFSLSLIIGSFLGLVIVFHHFVVVRQNELNAQKIFSYLNLGALVVGFLTNLGLAGVAAFPMTTVFWAHLLFAGMYFVGSAVYFVLISTLTYKIDGLSKKFLLRCVLSICILIFLFLIVILFPLALVKWHQFNDFIPALKKPESQGFTLLLLSSILEWSIVIVIVVFNLSLTTDLKKFSFTIAVSDPNKSAAVNEGPIPTRQ